MSEDQFRAYRQTGMYGGYRVAFRKWPGMTVRGDGWTPGPATIELAKWLDGRLGAARPPWPLHAGDGDEDSLSTRSAKLGRGEEHRWWLRQWKTFDQGGRSADENTLPRRKNDFAMLPEADLLKPLVFGERPERKAAAATWRARWRRPRPPTTSRSASTWAARSPATAPLRLLPRFSRLADAGMAAMDLVAESLQNDSRVELADVAAHPRGSAICEELMAAAQEWRKDAEMQLRHIETAHRFASAIPSARPIECLRALLQHHELYGGGLRWFVLRNGWVEPRTPRAAARRATASACGRCAGSPRNAASSATCRAALLEDDEAEEDETSEAADE